MKVVGRKGRERNGAGRCLVEEGEQKFEERKVKRVVLVHKHQEFKGFLLRFSRNCVGISLPFKAVSGEVKIKVQIVLLCFSCNWAILPSV